MNLERKLYLIDEYLESATCNREWEIMILEYREMLIKEKKEEEKDA